MRYWWGKRRQMVLPGRGGTPEEDRRRKSINPGFWRSYHNTLMLGKLRQAVRRATNKEGVGCLLTEKKCTKIEQPVSEVLWENHPVTRVFPEKNLCAQPSRSMRKCLKRYPLTLWKMTSYGLHQIFPALQAHWKWRQFSSVTGSFDLGACQIG